MYLLIDGVYWRQFYMTENVKQDSQGRGKLAKLYTVRVWTNPHALLELSSIMQIDLIKSTGVVEPH